MAEKIVTREEFNSLTNKVDSIDQRLEKVENKLCEIEKRLFALEVKINELEGRLIAAFERHIGKLLAGPLHEEFIHRLEVIGEGFGIHEQRITTLEVKTGLR